MKKLIAILLILSTLILSSCGLPEGIELIETNEYAKITLDGFEGKEKIKLVNGVGEGSLYYKTNITNGSIDVSFSDGLTPEALPLFKADSENNSNGGTYVSAGGKVTVIITASEAATGEIVFVFSQSSSPFK